jgi:hypothetical protein
MIEHDKYCLYYGTHLDPTNCVDCKRLTDVRKDERGKKVNPAQAITLSAINTRNQIFTDVDNYYEYWADEMSSDANEWVQQILKIIMGEIPDYPMEEE